MKRKDKLPELLAPAGSFDALVAAISAGADAVYIGAKSFGARAYAKNFELEELKRATELCHLHGVKIYVTLNTLVYDKELSELSDLAAALYEIGIDAVISADIGVISEIRRRVPELPIHASTQASVHNTNGADALYKMGAERVVTARELSIKEINSVCENSNAEIEVFLHGALCVCYSGQCLFSSLVGGRSGNRGECAQPCRLPYSCGYQLSLKDLSLHAHIKELISSGVASLKIEGRMKSPEYVYRVTKIYRELLDAQRDGGEKEEKRLREIFSRDGFTDGYLRGRTEKGMLGIRSESDKAQTKAQKEDIPSLCKIPVKAKAALLLGKPSELTLSTEKRSVTVTGPCPEPAKSAPLSADSVAARLMKMGNTDFSLSKKDIEVTLDSCVNLSPSAINELRREAAARLADTSRKYTERGKYVFKPSPVQEKPFTTVYFYNPALLCDKVVSEKLKGFDAVFIPLQKIYEIKTVTQTLGVCLPPVIFDSEMREVEEMMAEARARGIKYAMAENVSHISIINKYGMEAVGGFRLNVTNSLSRDVYRKLGIKRMLISPELTLPMARDIGEGVIVYGRIPLMLTERCFIRDSHGCEECSRTQLLDRTGAKFPIIREFRHRNLIINSTPTYMGDKKAELDRARLHFRHMIFTVESAKEVADIISKHNTGAPLGIAVRRMGKREGKQ